MGNAGQEREQNLESIPGIGPALAKKLKQIGFKNVSDLRNKDPEKMYEDLQKKLGAHVDRCVLYVFRSAVYYASNLKHDPELLKWWKWKEK